jgi:hypothetical protein
MLSLRSGASRAAQKVDAAARTRVEAIFVNADIAFVVVLRAKRRDWKRSAGFDCAYSPNSTASV